MQFDEYIRKLGVLDTLRELEYRVRAEVVNRFNAYLDLAREDKLELDDMVVQSFFYEVATGEYDEKCSRDEVVRNAILGIRGLECASEYSNDPISPFVNHEVYWNDAPVASACMKWYYSNEGDLNGSNTPYYSFWEIGDLNTDDVFCQYHNSISKLKEQVMTWITYFLMDNPIQCADGEYWVLSEMEDWKYFISYLQSFLLKYIFSLVDRDCCFCLSVSNPFEHFALRYIVAYVLGKNIDLATYAKSLEIEDWLLYYYDETLFPDVDFGDIQKLVEEGTEGTIKPYYTKGALNLHRDVCALDVNLDEGYLETDNHGEVSLDTVYFAEKDSKYDYMIQDRFAGRADKFLYESVQ